MKPITDFSKIIEGNNYLVHTNNHWYVLIAQKEYFLIFGIIIPYKDCTIFELPKISKFRVEKTTGASEFLYIVRDDRSSIACFHFKDDVLLFLKAKEPEIKHEHTF